MLKQGKARSRLSTRPLLLRCLMMMLKKLKEIYLAVSLYIGAFEC